MFERFTGAARATINQAQEESALAGSASIGTEHLIVALADHPGAAGEALRRAGASAKSLRDLLPRPAGGPTIDGEALTRLGIDLDHVRRSVEDVFGEGALDLPAEAPHRERRFASLLGARLTDEFKQALERALRTAVQLGDQGIATEHLLLGVLDVADSRGLRLLVEHGIEPHALRATVTELHRRTA